MERSRRGELTGCVRVAQSPSWPLCPGSSFLFFSAIRVVDPEVRGDLFFEAEREFG